MEDNHISQIYEFYSSTTTKNVDWLWYPYIPYGKITLIQGDPGDGKSTFILSIASLLSRGLDMPDGFKVPEARNVIYQCSEDSIADTIKPRLISAGADCSKIAYIIDDDSTLTLSDDRIEQTISETRAGLFIIDPLQSYIGSDGDISNVSKMRPLLNKLSRISAKYNCAIVIVSHMNKSISGKNLYRSIGSIDIAAISRSVLMLIRDDNDTSLRHIIHVKSSLAKEGDGISFYLGSDKGIRWTNDTVPFLGDILEKNYSKSKRLFVADSLMEILANGSQPTTMIIGFFKQNGISERTVNEAKKNLNIQAFKKGNKWYWKLPEKE